MDECIFCKIVKGEIPSKKVHETENVLSFLDVNPRAPGHSLVIPKKHVKNLLELDDKTTENLLKVTQKVERALKESLNPDAFTLGINDGEAAGQEVPHLHLNIIPRFEGDGGRAIHSVVDNPPEEDLEEIKDRILKAKNEAKK